MAAGPFLKWAGGKSSMIEQYKGFFPREKVNTYFEPFLGSGAVFFHLRALDIARQYCLSDINEELINAYRVLRDRPDELITFLAYHEAEHGEEHYYAVRDADRMDGWPQSGEIVARAARMIYLNKTCYNGLWRVNSKGQFNVPMGRYENPAICDEERLRAASAALQGVSITVATIGEAMRDAGAGDFVYFDPPYVPLNETSDFTAYYEGGFGAEDQHELAMIFKDLDRRRCLLMLSNSETPFVRDLYADYRIETVQSQRRINSNAEKRGPIDEVVVLNF
jgi:DNA adenine methylase